jgi:hypothetical protein
MVVCVVSGLVVAQSNIDNSVPDKFAWGENIGWTNWHDANAGVQGVNVGGKFLAGYIWGENIGWINVGDGTPTNGIAYGNTDGSDTGVNIDPAGALHGYAWGENIGWINFDGGAMATPAQPARIDCARPPGQPLARLTGYVWGENVGWINLDIATAGQFVAIDLATTPRTCDMNHDGIPNGLDVQVFTRKLLLGGVDWRDICSGDLELTPDGLLDYDDVDPFVTCLLMQP